MNEENLGLGSETAFQSAVEYFGEFVANLNTVISLREAKDFLGRNFTRFLRMYARRDLDGLAAACYDKESLVAGDVVLIPEYRPHLELGMSVRLDYLQSRKKSVGREEREVAELLANPFLIEQVEQIDELKYESSDLLSSVEEELYGMYREAWKSGPHHIHPHLEHVKSRSDDGKTTSSYFHLPPEEEGKFYYPKKFKDFNADDHKTMAFVVRALSCGFLYGFDSWEQLEAVIYEALIEITNFDHYNVKGITLESCNDEGCKYYGET